MLHGTGSMSEYIVARKKGIFFLEHKTHMIMRVAWRMNRADRSPLDGKYLAVLNRLLAVVGRILVHAISQVWVHAEQVRHAFGVIAMPVRQEDMRKPYRSLM